MPANDNCTMPVVLFEALQARPDALEASIIRQWAKRDPLEAAMAAHSLHTRLRFGDDEMCSSAPQRPEVDHILSVWRAKYPPAVSLPASERLLEVMSRWADQEITPSRSSLSNQ